MITTVTLDDGLLAEAIECSGIGEKSKFINFALKELINRERAARFLALEGTMPDLDYTDRSYRSARNPMPISVLNDSND